MALGLLAAARYAWPFYIDDALITARYAHRLITGRGYTYNDGEPSDGVTGPLWLVPMMLGERLGGGALVWAKLASCLGMVAATTWSVARVRRRALGRLAAWPTTLICLTSMPIAVWAVAGLETGAAALVFVAMSHLATHRSQRSGLALGATAVVAVTLRPELLAAALSAIACKAFWARREAVQGLVTLMVGSASLALFRFLTFGALLPLSVSAKPAELVHGLGYLRAFMLRTDSLCFAILVAAACKYGRKVDRVACFMVVTHVCACTLAGGDWMPGRRLLVPALPVFAALAGVGFAHLYVFRSRWFSVLLAVGLSFSALELVRELPAARTAGKAALKNVANVTSVLREYPGTIVALDVGALGFALPERRILDLGGLTSPSIAYRAGGHLDKRIDPEWLREQAPTWIVLHSAFAPRVARDGTLLSLRGYPVEQHVAASAYVRRDFRVHRVVQIAPQYFYVFLLRSEVSEQRRD